MRARFFLLFVLVLCACTNSFTKTDWEKRDLKSGVKEVRETVYGESSTNESLFRFNEKGNITEESYGSGGNQNTFRTSYDGAGNIAETVEYDSKGRVVSKKTYRNKVDGAGRTVEQTILDTVEDYNLDKTAESRAVYHYDDAGRLTQKDVIGSQKNYSSTTSYRYDGKGNLAEETYKDSFATVKTAYGYDVSNRLVTVTSSDSAHAFTTLVSYDARDRVSEKLYRQSSGDYKIVYAYDEKGNVTESRWLEPNGSLKSRHAYTYIYY